MARTYSTKTTIDVSACSHRNKSIMKWKNYNQENGHYFVTATSRNLTPLFAGEYQGHFHCPAKEVFRKYGKCPSGSFMNILFSGSGNIRTAAVL